MTENFVNATRRHALRAAQRTNSDAGSLSESFDVPQTKWWHKYFKWEANLTVAGRTIEKGWVVPQPLGVALLVVILGGVGSLYWRLTDRVDAIGDKQAAEMQTQREMLIRLDQKLTDKAEHDQEKVEEIKHQIGDLAAWQQVTNKDLARVIPWRAPAKIERK